MHNESAIRRVGNLKYENTDLTEVSDNVAALSVVLRENVEEKRFHVVVKGLVVQEEFG